MASYPAPTESFIGIIYNPLFFNRINLTDYVTYGYVQANFLSRVGVASSIATLTTFSGAVTILGLLTLSGGISISGGLTVDTLQVNSTSSFIGQSTFTLIPILPAGYQFITNGAQTIVGLKSFTSVLTTAGINDSLSITSPTITGSTIVNGGTFNATNIAGTSSFYGISVLGASTFNNNYPTTTLGNNISTNTTQFATVGYVNSNGGAALLASSNTWTNTNLFTQLVTFNNGLFVNSGNINTPNNAILGTTFCDQFNNYNQTTGTDITFNPNNFVQCVVNNGNNSILPSTVIGYGGLKIGWNCSNSIGETDFINLANYTNTGGFNYYTMNASNLPSLIGSLTPSALTITGSLINAKISNSSSTLPYHIQSGTIPLPTTTTGDPRNGFLIGWNGLSGSNGETDFTNLNQSGNQGGFLFGNIPTGSSYQKLASLLPLNAGGLRLWPYCGNLRVDDNTNGAFSANMRQDGAFTVISSIGISTSLFLQCGNTLGVAVNVVQASVGGGFRIFPQCGKMQIDDINSGAFTTTIIQANNQSFYNATGINGQIVLQCGNASGVTTNAMAMTATIVQPFVNFSPSSTTTFNAFHPTTSLGNNLSTNTTQYATVGFVNANNGASILPLNNTWTGLNTFTQRIQMTIKTSTSTTCIGTNAGASLGTLASNANCTYYGFNAGVNSVNPQSETIIGAASGPIITGNFSDNTIVGANSVFNGVGNTILGASSGNTSTTTVYNNSTTVGIGVLMTASNQITLGRNTETVLIPGTLTTTGTTNINNTTMTGTAIVNNNLQVNGNITQPTGGILTGAVQTTFTTIPPYIIFIPVTGMSFVLPAPSAANAGQMFVIRRFGTGVGNPTIIFTCVGNLAVWVPLNSNATNTSLAISTVWQFTIVSANNVYITIA